MRYTTFRGAAFNYSRICTMPMVNCLSLYLPSISVKIEIPVRVSMQSNEMTSCTPCASSVESEEAVVGTPSVLQSEIYSHSISLSPLHAAAVVYCDGLGCSQSIWSGCGDDRVARGSDIDWAGASGGIHADIGSCTLTPRATGVLCRSAGGGRTRAVSAAI